MEKGLHSHLWVSYDTADDIVNISLFTSALREWVLDSREVKSEEKMSFTLFEKCK